MGIETAILGSAALGAGANIFGANKAAKAQTHAAQMGIDAQMKMFKEIQNLLGPYTNLGSQAAGDLGDRLDFLTSPIVMDQAALEQTPGYQFLLDQGNKNLQANAAARGLGNSGTALKAAQRFGINLADTTYQNQFNNENTNRANAFNRLFETARLGQSAASALANPATQTGQGISNNMLGAGNAQAGAYMAGANAIGNAGNSIMNYAMMNQYMNPGSGMYGSAPTSYYSMGGTQVPVFGSSAWG